MALQGRAVSPFSDGEVDRAGGARDGRDQGGLVAVARFAHPQPVQAEQDGES